jgi:hypothetical protein
MEMNVVYGLRHDGEPNAVASVCTGSYMPGPKPNAVASVCTGSYMPGPKPNAVASVCTGSYMPGPKPFRSFNYSSKLSLVPCEKSSSL